jgi:hypothetical protein
MFLEGGFSMRIRFYRTAAMVALVGCLLAPACSKKQKEAASPPADTTKTISYISHDISFGVFFDDEGTKRTLTLQKGQKQAKIYVFVEFPETMKISAVEYRLSFPEGATIESDKFYEHRIALLGTFEEGISETFPCAAGPKLLLHVLTLNLPSDLKNAEVAILASKENHFLGVATCEEGLPMLQASSYRAVINPTE